jgi:hypothetical protein
MVCNDLDAAASQGLYGSDPIGFECQETIWGYKRTDALGNLYFRKIKLINKGAFYIDSMYVAQWSDPDLGDSGDDLTGCDTTLSLGMVYNGNAVDGEFVKFGLAPPAVGYDFLQGPIVAGASTDSGVVNLKRVYGKKNLPMTSFSWFAAGSAISDPPQRVYEGTLRWWRMLQGYVPDGSTAAWRRYPSFPGVTPNAFPLSGDPVTRSGQYDGLGTAYSFAPGDRRLNLSSGPFRLAVGDTQEVVVGTVAGIGADRLSSITVMKFNDKFVQLTYDGLFAVPKSPAKPDVKFANLDGEVVLEWGSNPERTKAIEQTASFPGNYTFEGYNVYQFPSRGASLSDAKRIATYDLTTDPTIVTDQGPDPATGLILTKPVQFGSNSGILRTFHFAKDFVKDISRLFNGSEYYLAVTAYTVSRSGFLPAALESSPDVLTVVPQSLKPGVRLGGPSGDTVRVTLTTLPGGSPSDGSVTPIIVDPTKLTGHNYRVTFAVDGTSGETYWILTDRTTGQVKLTRQFNQTGDEDYTIVDGLQVKVAGPPPGMKAWSIPSGTRRFSPVGGAGLALEGFSNGGDPNAAQDQTNGSIGMGGNFPFAVTTLTPSDYRNVLLKLAAVDNTTLWNPRVAPTDANFSRGYRYLRGATSPPQKVEFTPWIVNATAGYAYQDYNYGIPFSAWNMETTPPTRLAIGHLENNSPATTTTSGKVDGIWWPGTTDTNNTAAAGPREWFFIFATPYTETAQAQYTTDISNNFSGAVVPLMWAGSPARRAEAAWAAGDEFMIIANHINTPLTQFDFTAPLTGYDAALATKDIGNINVFPNPYYAFNPQETSRHAKFVTFTKLPARATLRIFNLAGQLVRTLEKTDATTQFLPWDLNNRDAFPVASGMYIVHIDMPDIGATKVVKVGIIQEQEVPDIF